MNKNLKEFQKELSKVARELEIDPRAVTPAQFKASSER